MSGACLLVNASTSRLTPAVRLVRRGASWWGTLHGGAGSGGV